MFIDKLRQYLDHYKVDYTTSSHPLTYTAQETAEASHVSGQNFAKTVMARIDGQLSMLVLPAKYQVDFTRLGEALGTTDIYLVPEEEFSDEFPDCEVGAMPPFGNLYGMPVYIACSLAEDDYITFNAGTHTDTLTLDFEDFELLVKPKIVPLTDRNGSLGAESLAHV